MVAIYLANFQATAAEPNAVKPLELQLFKPGETLSFTYETKVHNATGGSDPVDSSLTETFEIKSCASHATTQTFIGLSQRHLHGRL